METILTFLKISDYLTWETVEITVLILAIIFVFYILFKQAEKEDKEKQKKQEDYQKERKLEEQKKQEKWKTFIEKEDINLILEDEELFLYFDKTTYKDTKTTEELLLKENNLIFLINLYNKMSNKKISGVYYQKLSRNLVFEEIKNKFNLSLKDNSMNLDICYSLYKLLIIRGHKDENLFFNRVKLGLDNLLDQELKLIEEKENPEEKIDLLEKLFQKFPDNKKLKLIIAGKINELVKTTQ